MMRSCVCIIGVRLKNKRQEDFRDTRALKRVLRMERFFHKQFLPCRRPQAHINIEDLDQNKVALLENKHESL